jgi:23S rRNA (adenine1618-N6)-methyltransferase
MKNLAPKFSLHPRNLHQGRYDLEALVGALPELKAFIFTNVFGNQTINFSDPKAVKILNRALLKKYYKVDFWDIPEGFLCPPIPGRADYIHHLADLLAQSNGGNLPRATKIRVLDIGTGANLIYPLLGAAIYDWKFVGSELNPIALDAAKSILDNNPNFQGKIELRSQSNVDRIFEGIIQQEEFFDLMLCNPPFHESATAAQEGSRRKVRNLTGKAVSKAKLNFGGQSAELWTEGGELEFIRKMIQETSRFKSQVFWFTTLVSKSENLKPIEAMLKRIGVAAQKTVPMAQGNKQSRFVAWTFFSEKQRQTWSSFRWNQ